MEAAHEALVAAYDELGCPIGRTPTDRQEWAMQRLPEFRRLASGMKSAHEAKGVIAPGKYAMA
jgi:4-cresol dehydrogenase (hydroxylating) flavoprotein subunit